MAFSSYAELQASVADWLNRTDLTSRIPDFIALCEAQISRDVRSRTLKAALLIDDAIVTPGSQYALDANLLYFGEPRSIVLKGSLGSQNGPITIVTPEVLSEQRRRHTSTGQPRYATFVNGDFEFVPAPDADYDAEVTFYEALIPLSSVSPNDVLSNAPDIYLYGTLVEAAAFLEHDERIGLWQARYDKAVRKFNEKREREEYGASLRPVRLPVVF